jgi:predicted nucleic acid-binding protein
MPLGLPVAPKTSSLNRYVSIYLSAKEVQAGRLIIDEYRGRKAATERGLRVVGTVGVLELAAEMGFIDLKEAFERVKQTDFWISRKLLDERLALFLGRRPAP